MWLSPAPCRLLAPSSPGAHVRVAGRCRKSKQPAALTRTTCAPSAKWEVNEGSCLPSPRSSAGHSLGRVRILLELAARLDPRDGPPGFRDMVPRAHSLPELALRTLPTRRSRDEAAAGVMFAPRSSMAGRRPRPGRPGRARPGSMGGLAAVAENASPARVPAGWAGASLRPSAASAAVTVGWCLAEWDRDSEGRKKAQAWQPRGYWQLECSGACSATPMPIGLDSVIAPLA